MFIGAGARILGNVQIGRHAVIGAMLLYGNRFLPGPSWRACRLIRIEGESEVTESPDFEKSP